MAGVAGIGWKVARNGGKVLEIAGNGWSCWIWLEMAGNGWKWLEMARMARKAGYSWK